MHDVRTDPTCTKEIIEPKEATKTIYATPDSSILTEVLLDDLFRDFKDKRWWVRTLLEPIARPASHRFARVFATLDYIIAHGSFRDAMRYAVSVFATSTRQIGCEHVPAKGPLLVVSNHPGTCDSMVITSNLPRDDIKIIATGFPLLRNLPNVSQHLIYTDPRASLTSNIPVIRASIRHLKSGGALMIFPSGRIEPDPSVLPGAMESIRTWSPSIELFLRKVPQTKIQFTVVSGVLAPEFLHHPLIKPLTGSRNPQAIAETLQIVTQMWFKRLVKIKPVISFGIPKTVEELQKNNDTLYLSIINEACRLLTCHMQSINI